ncbi:MAG: hypothetical protein F4Y26_19960 [Gammaproteobacteria bacterium]|nr:hypothetical protein [Gammaproteobacteria bacterium]
MDWIEGYKISGDSLYSPSGEKIAAISRYYGGDFAVMPISPEIVDADTSGAKSPEAACIVLIHAHAQNIAVMPVAEVRDMTINVANQIVQASGDNNKIETSQALERQIKDADSKTLLQIFKGVTAKEIIAGSVATAMVAAAKAFLG